MQARTHWLIAGMAALAIWTVAATLNGQAKPAPGPTRTAVVNLVNVFNQFEQTQVLNRKMKDYQTRLRDEKNQKEVELESAVQTLQSFKPDSPEFQAKNKEVLQMQIEYEVWQRLQQENLARNHKLWIQRTYDMIVAEVEKVAKARGFDIVITEEDLEREAEDTQILLRQIFNRKVVYSDPSIDISDEVLTNLNEAFAKGGGADSVKFSR